MHCWIVDNMAFEFDPLLPLHPNSKFRNLLHVRFNIQGTSSRTPSFYSSSNPKIGDLKRKLSIFLSGRKLLNLLKRNLGNLTKKSHVFQNTWAYCFPQANNVVRDNGLISQVWCTTCNNVESKMKLLSTKLYTFQKTC